MIFNFTDNYKFTTRLQVKENNVEIVDQMKILGTIVNNTLSWDENCNHLIKKWMQECIFSVTPTLLVPLDSIL